MSEVEKPSEGQVDLSNPTIQNTGFVKEDVRRIVLKKNEVIRIAFLSDTVELRLRHYLKGAGYRRCLSAKGWCPACIAAEKDAPPHLKKDGLKRATEAFGANVFLFKTEKTDMDPAAPLTPINGNIHLFVFGTEKFAAIRAIKNMYGSLVGLDLQITCTDEDFQKMNVTAYPKEKSLSSNAQVFDFMLKKLEKQKYPLDKMIAKEVDPFKMIDDYKLNSAMKDSPEGRDFYAIANAVGATPPPVEEEGVVLDTTSFGAIAPPTPISVVQTEQASTPVAPPAPKETIVISNDSILDEI